MPLKEGSSDKIIQDNIRCILDKDGCGYDPPYKDPAREEYTPAQAAAIAYAKAGKRKSKPRKSSASKKSKSVEGSKEKFSEGSTEEQMGASAKPVQSKNIGNVTNTDGPQIPEGWRSI